MTYENDFAWRGDLWRTTREDEDAFWRGEIIKHPTNDRQQHYGRSHSYSAHLMEEPVFDEIFLYCIWRQSSLVHVCSSAENRPHEFFF